jgi:hypothetical protein
MRKITAALVSALTLAGGTLTPAIAYADDDGRHWRGRDGYHRYHRGYDRHHYDRDRWRGDYRRHHKDDDDGDAIAAGVIGLVLGGVLGAALASDPEPRYGPGPGYYQAPPPAYYPPPQYQSYDPGYYGPGYGGTCYRRELQWDPRSRRNIEVTHPYPC